VRRRPVKTLKRVAAAAAGAAVMVTAALEIAYTVGLQLLRQRTQKACALTGFVWRLCTAAPVDR